MVRGLALSASDQITQLCSRSHPQKLGSFQGSFRERGLKLRSITGEDRPGSSNGSKIRAGPIMRVDLPALSYPVAPTRVERSSDSSFPHHEVSSSFSHLIMQPFYHLLPSSLIIQSPSSCSLLIIQPRHPSSSFIMQSPHFLVPLSCSLLIIVVSSSYNPLIMCPLLTQSLYHIFPSSFSSLIISYPHHVVSSLYSPLIILFPYHIVPSSYSSFIIQFPHYVVFSSCRSLIIYSPHDVVLSPSNYLTLLSPFQVFLPSGCSFTIYIIG